MEEYMLEKKLKMSKYTFRINILLFSQKILTGGAQMRKSM